MSREETLQFIHHKPEEVRILIAGDGGEVGVQKDVGQADDLVVGGNRFGVKNVEYSGNVALFEAYDESLGVDDGAAGDIDEGCLRRFLVRRAWFVSLFRVTHVFVVTHFTRIRAGSDSPGPI